MITVHNHINLNNQSFAKNHHTIIWATEAKGKISVNHKEYNLGNNSIITAGKDQPIKLFSPASVMGFQVCFQDDDFPHSAVDSVCRIVILYNHINIHNLIHIPSESSKEFKQLFSLMYQEDNSSTNQKSSSILSLLLQTLLLKIEKVIREKYLSDSEENIFEEGELSDFMEHLESRHKKLHKVQDYASLMAISTRKLNDIIKHYFGLTAKELISTKLYIEIASKLQFSNNSIKEIAYQFGFSSPYHFSNFFTKTKGISPQAYRNSLQK